jgi:hypothetical protein
MTRRSGFYTGRTRAEKEHVIELERLKAEALAACQAEIPVYQQHPFARILPRMSEREAGLLADDIKVNGLRDPIVRHNGTILDGWERYMACYAAGIVPHFIDLTDDEDPFLFLKRKHRQWRKFDPDQRALCAANEYNTRNQSDTPIGGKTVDDLAKEWMVPKRTLERAIRVLDQAAPAVVMALMKGAVKLYWADNGLKHSHAEQLDRLAARKEQKGRARASAKNPYPVLEFVHEVKVQLTDSQMELVRADMKAAGYSDIVKYVVAKVVGNGQL